MGIIKEIVQPPIPPYQDIPYKGGTDIRSLKELKVGGGTDILKVNKEGLFMGADNFTDAPFSVDYDGNITGTSLTIADGSITTAKLADEAVTAGKIKTGDITATQIASSTITTTQIKAGTIVTGDIGANTILAGNIAANAIETSELKADCVTTAKIDAGAVGTTEIANTAITTAKIKNANITEAKIGSLAVTVGKIGSLAVTNAKIANATIAYGKIASVSATTISTGTLTGRTIRTAAPGVATGSAVVITGGNNQNVSFYYNASSRGFIRGYTTVGSEVTYIGIEATSGRKLELKNSYISCNGNFLPNADNSHTMGSSTNRWSDGRFEDITVDDLVVSVGCTGCAYQEMNLLTETQRKNYMDKRNKEAKLKGRKAKDILAEQKTIREEYRKYNPTGFERGDVLVWDNDKLQKCKTDSSNLVLAISSEKGLPIVLGAESVKVTGKCKIGQMLVTSDIEGHARVLGEEESKRGAIIAMALEDKKSNGCNLVKAMIQKM